MLQAMRIYGLMVFIAALLIQPTPPTLDGETSCYFTGHSALCPVQCRAIPAGCLHPRRLAGGTSPP